MADAQAAHRDAAYAVYVRALWSKYLLLVPPCPDVDIEPRHPKGAAVGNDIYLRCASQSLSYSLSVDISTIVSTEALVGV